MTDQPTPAPSERLIVALDFPSAVQADLLVNKLHGLVSFYKVGLELYTVIGPDYIRSLLDRGNKVFLDLKFYDIGETVRRATRQAARLGATFLTVHEAGRTVSAAALGCAGTDLRILAITVLTSMGAEDIAEMGLRGTVEELALQRAEHAIAQGCHGVVASGFEARAIRRMAGPGPIIVTPGIRPAGASEDDQKRATTPAAAIKAGADYLVVGRPIRDAKDPAAVANGIITEIQQSLAAR